MAASWASWAPGGYRWGHWGLGLMGAWRLSLGTLGARPHGPLAAIAGQQGAQRLSPRTKGPGGYRWGPRGAGYKTRGTSERRARRYLYGGGKQNQKRNTKGGGPRAPPVMASACAPSVRVTVLIIWDVLFMFDCVMFGNCVATNDHPRRDTEVISRQSKALIDVIKSRSVPWLNSCSIYPCMTKQWFYLICVTMLFLFFLI